MARPVQVNALVMPTASWDLRAKDGRHELH